MAPLLDKIQKISPKTRLIVFISLIVLLLVAYILQFQIPMNTQIKQLEQSLSGLQAKISENDNKIRNLDELKIEVKTLQKQTRRAYGTAPAGIGSIESSQADPESGKSVRPRSQTLEARKTKNSRKRTV